MSEKRSFRLLIMSVLLLVFLASVSSCSLLSGKSGETPEQTEQKVLTSVDSALTSEPQTAGATETQAVKTIYVTATPTPPPVIKVEPTVKTWNEGTYEVGKDLEAGEYILIASNAFSAYLEIASDDSRAFESIIHNDNFYNRTRVALEASDFFSFNNATLYRTDDAPPVPREGNLPEGMYLVGTDIEAGTYELEATEDIGGYYAVFDNARHDKYGYLNNFNFIGTAEVTVSDGEYLHVARAVILRP